MNAYLQARKSELEARVERPLNPLARESGEPLAGADREFLLDQARDLYWNELEWEHLTDEERLDDDLFVEQAFPGLLAFVRGLLLEEVMPDALAPASPRPGVVAAVLEFLSAELERRNSGTEDGDGDETRLAAEISMTGTLIDLVMGLLYGLSREEMESVRAARRGE